MAKTSVDARRHIRELSRLFSGVNAVGTAIIEEFLKKSKKRKYMKQSLRRLIERKFLVEENSGFTPTAKGLIHFRRIFPQGKKIVKIPKEWDGKWRLISFDVPCECDVKRNKIRSLLKEFDFFQLQKSVWVCPTCVSGKLWKMIVDEDLDGYCKTMVVDILEGDNDLKRHFRLS